MHKQIILLRGDITQQDAEAVVNAANSSLRGGGGVDGAIHRAGGVAILEAKFVIHTVGPIWRGGDHNEDQLLADAYRNSLALAREHNIKTIAFPSISTGAYRFPIDRAAHIALNTVDNFLTENPGLHEVRFVLFSEQDLVAYKNASVNI